jgi:hypothetical protein
VAVRVNPDFELKGSGMKMGGGPKQFGVDVEQVPELLAASAAPGLAVRGLPPVCRLAEPARRVDLRGAAERATSWRCGWPRMRRRRCASSTWAAASASRTSRASSGSTWRPSAPTWRRWSRACARDAAGELVIELGRYLVGEAGVYVTRVVDRKVSRGQVFLVTDGGLNHHLSASGNFGQVVRKNYPVTIGNRMDAGARRREVASVVGPAVHAAGPAGRPHGRCRWPRSATWWWSSSPAPTAPAPARRPFWGSAPAAAASAAVVPATPAATVEAPAPTMRESLQREAAEFAAAQKQAEAQPEGEPLPTPMRDDQSRREQTADHEALRSAVDKLGLRSTLWWLRENRDWLFTLIVLGVAAGLAVTAWRRSRGVLADHRRRKRQERRRAERALAEQAAAPVPSRSSHRTGESARRRDPVAAVDAASHHRSDGSRRRRSHRSSAALRPHRATR